MDGLRQSKAGQLKMEAVGQRGRHILFQRTAVSGVGVAECGRDGDPHPAEVWHRIMTD